ncbi:hypothetical protein IC582_011006 [Cucumis melo]
MGAAEDQKLRCHLKLTLFEKSIAFIGGQNENKLIFSGHCTLVSNQQNESLRAILGKRNLLELTGNIILNEKFIDS